MPLGRIGFCGLFVFLITLNCATGQLVWPTPNPAFQNGAEIDAFIQPTVSGKVRSGLFGCVRNSGQRFHEGLDLYPLSRDKKGEALDSVYSVLPGRIMYINSVVGHSSYGRYVVVEHFEDSLAFHSLYAHLAKIDRSIHVGSSVEAGTVLGIMGRSAGGYSIPKERAHVHFELGFRLTDAFQNWYDAQKFGSKNRHGMWNGMNLVSVDPLRFYEARRGGRIGSFKEHIEAIPVVARIRVFEARVPAFVQNFPELVTREYERKDLVAWDIGFTQYGVPKQWTPRFKDEDLDGKAGDVKVIAYNFRHLEGQSCRSVLELRGRVPKIAKATIINLKKLFEVW